MFAVVWAFRRRATTVGAEGHIIFWPHSTSSADTQVFCGIFSLLSCGANVMDHIDHNEQTTLHTSMEMGLELDVIWLPIDQGANLATTYEYGCTVLKFANHKTSRLDLIDVIRAFYSVIYSIRGYRKLSQPRHVGGGRHKRSISPSEPTTDSLYHQF
jgi:hypothetical protein